MPSDKALDRVGRILDLIPFLSRREVNLREIAAKLGIPMEQLQRDLEISFLCGLPGYTPDLLIDISLDQESVFVMNPQSLDRPREISDEELMALNLGLELIAAQYAGAKELETIVASLKEKLGGSARDPASHQSSLNIQHAENLRIIESAILQEHRIGFSYIDIQGRLSEKRVVSPWEITWNQGRMILKGFDHDRDASRDFFVFRMSDPFPLEGKWFDPKMRTPQEITPNFAVMRLSRVPMWWRRRNSATIVEMKPGQGFQEVTVRYWNRESLIQAALPLADLLISFHDDAWPDAEIKAELLRRLTA